MIRVHGVSSDHYVLVGDGKYTPGGRLKPSKLLNVWAQKWWRKVGVKDAESAVVAMDADTLIGFFRYTITEDNGKRLMAMGTWVSAQYRRQGIATRMWTKAMYIENPEEIYVMTLSTSGHALGRKMGRKAKRVGVGFEQEINRGG